MIFYFFDSFPNQMTLQLSVTLVEQQVHATVLQTLVLIQMVTFGDANFWRS